MTTGKPITDHELMAYVDNQLDAARREQVSVHLQRHPAIANELNEYQQFNEAFHRLFDSVLDEPIPRRLTNSGKPSRRWQPLAQVASLLIAVVAGAVLGWIARGENPVLPWTSHSPTQAMVQDAFAYHAVYTPEVKHPVEVTADNQQHLVNWLSKRLQTPVRVPQLSAQGFNLLGGRLLTSGQYPAAQFMYENAAGQRVTLFTRKRASAESDTAFRYASRGAINGFYWVDGESSFALLADIPRQRISELAHYVYEDLNK